MLSSPYACPPQPPPLASLVSFSLSFLALQALAPRHRPCALSRPRPSLSRRPPPPPPPPPLVLALVQICIAAMCSEPRCLEPAGCRLHGPTRQISESSKLQVPAFEYKQDSLPAPLSAIGEFWPCTRADAAIATSVATHFIVRADAAADNGVDSESSV